MEAKHKTPKYRRHRSGGLDRAFVELNGRRIYLGRYGSPGSREKYDQGSVQAPRSVPCISGAMQ